LISLSSAKGNPLIGVSIHVEGTPIGTTTDRTGKFSLSVSDNAVLVVSHVGYGEKPMGAVCEKYKGMKKIMNTEGRGGSSVRGRLWKNELERLAD
jgi:hypothetical protein